MTSKKLEATHCKRDEAKKQRTATLDHSAELDFNVTFDADDVDIDALPAGSQSSQSSTQPLQDGLLALPPMP